MLKIWKGPEMEGCSLGEITLFVCSDELLPMDKILDIMKQYDEVTKVYLGAGRERFRGFDYNTGSNYEFIQFCKDNNINITIECEVNDIVTVLDYLPYAEIILTVRNDTFNVLDVKDIKLKLDDYNTARIYDNFLHYDTNLLSVFDNIYDCDEVIYEEK